MDLIVKNSQINNNPPQEKNIDVALWLRFLKEQKIAKWEFSERLETLTEWPISGGGKIQKNKLTEMVAGKLKAEGMLSD